MVQKRMPASDGPGGLFSGRPALPIIGALAAALLIGVVLVAGAACGGGGGGDSKGSADDPFHAGLASSTEVAVEATVVLQPTAVPTTNVNLTKLGPNDRMVISRFGVDAPLSYKAVGTDGQMPDPETPDDVAYYDFTAWPGLGGGPGLGGNSIFAGHVDSGRKACKNGSVKPPCQAVFWEAKNLKADDEIELKVDGQSYKYKVKTNQSVPANSSEWDKIVAATAEETITLITCGGTFSNGEYNNRQVVTAVRMRV